MKLSKYQSARASERMSPAFRDDIRQVQFVLLDFDRTLLQLFDDETLTVVTLKLKGFYLAAGVSELEYENYHDPYSLWTGAFAQLCQTRVAEDVSFIQRGASALLGRFETLAAAKANWFPGVTETLNWLVQHELPCAIVSSNSTEAVLTALQRNKALNLFQAVCGRTDDSSLDDLKPKPRPLLRALQELNGTPERACLIGDSLEDALAAQSAGILFIGVLTGKRTIKELSDAGASIVLPDFSALQHIDVAVLFKKGKL